MQRLRTIGWILAILISFSPVTAQEATLYRAGKVYTMTGPALTPGQVLVVAGGLTQTT